MKQTGAAYREPDLARTTLASAADEARQHLAVRAKDARRVIERAQVHAANAEIIATQKLWTVSESTFRQRLMTKSERNRWAGAFAAVLTLLVCSMLVAMGASWGSVFVLSMVPVPFVYPWGSIFASRFAGHGRPVLEREWARSLPFKMSNYEETLSRFGRITDLQIQVLFREPTIVDVDVARVLVSGLTPIASHSTLDVDIEGTALNIHHHSIVDVQNALNVWLHALVDDALKTIHEAHPILSVSFLPKQLRDLSE